MISRPFTSAWRFAVNLMRLKNVGLAILVTEYEMAPDLGRSCK